MKRSICDGILQVCSDDGSVFLTISELQKDGIFEVVCAGDLRKESVPELEDELMALLSANDSIRLNLQKTDYISGSALSCLLTVQKAADKYGKAGLLITALSQTVRTAFEKTGLQEILLIDPDASIAGPEDLNSSDLHTAESVSGRWFLIRESGPDSSSEPSFIQIPEGTFILGRVPGKCDYVISGEPGISSSHAAFICESGTLYIKDLHSRNGTFVNGSKIPSEEKMILHQNDRVRLCREVFVVQTAAS